MVYFGEELVVVSRVEVHDAGGVKIESLGLEWDLWSGKVYVGRVVTLSGVVGEHKLEVMGLLYRRKL